MKIKPALLLAFLRTQQVHSNGFLKSPRSRNLVAHQDGVWWPASSDTPAPESCPQCLDRGGSLARCGVTGGRNYDEPKDSAGGEMRQNVQATYRQGEEVEVEVVLTDPPEQLKGHFVFKACPISPGEVPTQECFDQHPLEFVQDLLYDAVKDNAHPDRAYVASYPATSATSPLQSDSDTELSGWLFSYKLRLPSTLVGDLVLIQWHYLTAANCRHEGYENYNFPSEWSLSASSDVCQVSSNGDGEPKQFWNCAEVTIRSSSDTSSEQSSSIAVNPSVPNSIPNPNSQVTAPIPGPTPATRPLPFPSNPSPAYDIPTLSTLGKLITSLQSTRQQIDSKILLYKTPSHQWEPSSVYRFDDLLESLKVMAMEGVAGKKFYVGEDQGKVGGYEEHVYGMANIAAFLAQSMKETIQYDACDENSWDLVNGKYPLSNACGQLGQSYQDYHCSDEEKHMECPVDPNMSITAVTHAKWYGAPGPLFCGPKSEYSFTGFWDYGYECNKSWANPPEICDVYEGQKAGRYDQSAPFANNGGRTDVEGCCWWGRGVIQTTGVCNFGKLNYFLGARAAADGRPSRYPSIDFCKDPEAICASQQFKELKWIAGMFYWVESMQSYQSDNWDYVTELRAFVDGGMKDTGFINAVSGIVNRGCHDPPCKTGPVDGPSERRDNFNKVLETFFVAPPPIVTQSSPGQPAVLIPSIPSIPSTSSSFPPPTVASSNNAPIGQNPTALNAHQTGGNSDELSSGYLPQIPAGTINESNAVSPTDTSASANALSFVCGSSTDIPSDVSNFDIFFSYEVFVRRVANIDQLLLDLKRNMMQDVANTFGCRRQFQRRKMADDAMLLGLASADVGDKVDGQTVIGASCSHSSTTDPFLMCLPVNGHLSVFLPPNSSPDTVANANKMVLSVIQIGMESGKYLTESTEKVVFVSDTIDNQDDSSQATFASQIGDVPSPSQASGNGTDQTSSPSSGAAIWGILAALFSSMLVLGTIYVAKRQRRDLDKVSSQQCVQEDEVGSTQKFSWTLGETQETLETGQPVGAKNVEESFHYVNTEGSMTKDDSLSRSMSSKSAGSEGDCVHTKDNNELELRQQDQQNDGFLSESRAPMTDYSIPDVDVTDVNYPSQKIHFIDIALADYDSNSNDIDVINDDSVRSGNITNGSVETGTGTHEVIESNERDLETLGDSELVNLTPVGHASGDDSADESIDESYPKTPEDNETVSK